MYYNLEVLPQKNQPNLLWYKHLVDFFEMNHFNELEPMQESFPPYALTDHQSTYLFYLGPNMDAITGDLKAVKGKTVRLKWFNPFTGQYLDGGNRSFKNGNWMGFPKPKELNAPMGILVLEVQ